MAKTTAAIDSSKYSSGLFQAILADKCGGCDRVIEVGTEKFCQTYAAPAAKWRLGLCNFATHVKPEIVTAATRINPLKASKRAAGKAKKK